MSIDSAATSESGVRRIRVERLFGQYSYDLFVPETPPGRAPRLLLLYGDNGSGKTSILRLLFYLLSPVDRQGHKTAASKIRFRKFAVELADGTTVVAERGEDTTRSYDLRVMVGGEVVASAPYGDDEPTPELDLSKPTEFLLQQERLESTRRRHQLLLETLRSLNLGALYVTDSRRVLSTVEGLGADPSADRERNARSVRSGEVHDASRSALGSAVSQISSWATQQAFKGSSQGEEDVNSAYAAIMRRLAHTRELIEQTISTEMLIESLKEQEGRSRELVRYGLMKPVLVDEMIHSLTDAPDLVKKSMAAVLDPYVAGLRARMDALEPIRQQFAAFVETMNSFYRNKQVDLDVSRGLRITAATGEELSPGLLSSGESQLLYIFATTLVARDRSSLFIVDEPELSLNVKWQRRLLDALLKITADSRIQFVFATHSIELLTQFSDVVCDLNSTQQPLFA